jgi:hypothetical protein
MGAPFNLKLVDAATPAEIVSTPSYTDIFNEVMGTAATPDDGFAENLAKLATHISAFEGDVGAANAEVDLAGAISSYDGVNPAPLDATISNYVGTIPAGHQFVTDGQALTPPAILELPISPSSGGVPAAPPILASHDFGTLKLGGPKVALELGTSVFVVNGTTLGLLDVQLINSDHPEWSIETTEHDTLNGDQHITYFVNVIPKFLGKSTAQVNTNKVNDTQYTIHTFTVDVVP